jgi:serine-type D-Ala-D-Ala carboxypeptidase (penicillin-binding protein 5/6)
VRWRRGAAAGAALLLLGGQGSAAVAAAPHPVPPAAPRPTSVGSSPDAPDPHPPRGGIGPDGAAVGGARLLARGLVLPPRVAPPPSSVTAQAWTLVDLDSGDVLAARDPHGRYQPASILKTLTAVTLLPLLPGRRLVTASAAAASAEGSRAGLVAGGRYTVDQLFTGLLLVSGNDTAAALAEAAGGYRRTVALMNRAAQRLGAYDTYVQTPSGLDGWQQLTSAYDMALVLRAAVAQPRFVRYDRQPTGALPRQRGNDAVAFANQNETFLRGVPGALVAKTGFTDAAAHTFAGAITRNGRRLGVVFLRAQRWPTDQWQQATDLMTWGFRLPRGTAPVGHLDAAVHAAADRPERTAAPATSTASTAATARNPAAGPPTRRAQPAAIWLPVTAASLVLAGGLAWRLRRRPRRT